MIDNVQMIIAIVFLAAATVCAVITVVGIYRLPDFYARCHASGITETLALMLTCIGFMFYSGFGMISIKLAILFLVVCACNPIGSHVLTRAAYKGEFPMTLAGKKEK